MSLNQTFPTPYQIVYPDPITQLWQGNPLAYVAGGLLVALVAIIVALVIVKMKMPTLAMKLLLNNIRGGGAIIASIYENNVVKFFLPKVFQSGVGYDGQEWSIFAKAYAKDAEGLSTAERELLMSACHIEGAPGQLYFNYSLQGQVITPKLLAMLQHEREIQRLSKEKKVYIPKEKIIAVLNAIPEKEVCIETMNICLPVNLKGIKTALPKSLRKFDLKAIQHLVEDWVRGRGTGFNWALGACILSVITLVVVVIMHFV
jgi:hypothetical protein